MTSSKPLTYESLKTVLLFMDGNKRFLISQQCPSMRKTEKVVPLFLDSLTFGGKETKINKVSYMLFTHREYPDGRVIDDHSIIRCAEIVDKYDAPQESSIPLMPGDIYINDASFVKHGTDEQIIESNLKEFKRMERRIKKYKDDDCYSREELKKELELQKEAIQPFINRRDKILPEYKIMIRIQTYAPRLQKPGWIMDVIGLEEAIKRMNTVFLGGRTHPIRVKHLDIGSCTGTLRLPLGLKFKVQKLSAIFKVSRNLTVLNPILEENNLEVLTSSFHENFIGNSMVNNAKKLYLYSTWMTPRTKYASIISQLRNHEICFIQSQDLIHLEIFESVVKRWKEIPKEVGANYSFIVIESYLNTFLVSFREMIERMGGVENGEDRSFIIPLNNSTVFHVSHDPATFKFTLSVVAKIGNL